MSSKDPKIDIKDYFSITEDCLSEIDEGQDLEPLVTRNLHSERRLPRKKTLFNSPVFVIAYCLLAIDLLCLGIYLPASSEKLNQQQANEALKKEFLSDYKTVEKIDKFLIVADEAMSPKEAAFTEAVESLNSNPYEEFEDTGFEPQHFRFLGDQFFYIEPEN